MTHGHGIKGTVGRVDLKAENNAADVRRVQQLLALAAKVCKDQLLDPKSQSGTIDAATVAAMIAFQKKRKRDKPGGYGLFYPGGKSITKLLGVERTRSPNIGDGPYFPFSRAWVYKDWRWRHRNFAWSRGPFADGTPRAHAACDLWTTHGRAIYAVRAGRVIGKRYFYYDTWTLEIDHGPYVIRYGEVSQKTLVQVGDEVLAGQKIARVGHLKNMPGWESDMLHLELYDKTAAGELSQPPANSKKVAVINKNGEVRATGRRTDLINPAAYLDRWYTNLPISY